MEKMGGEDGMEKMGGEGGMVTEGDGMEKMDERDGILDEGRRRWDERRSSRFPSHAGLSITSGNLFVRSAHVAKRTLGLKNVLFIFAFIFVTTQSNMHKGYGKAQTAGFPK